MMSRGRLIFIFVSLATVFLVVGGSIASTAGEDGDKENDSLLKYLSVFTDVLSLVQRAYVDEAEVEDLMTGAFEGAVDALDPFALYIPSDRAEAYEQVRRVGTTRSGLLVLKEGGVAFAAAVEAGSPAAGAGLERGDVISIIQGLSTREIPLFEVHTLLAGEPGTTIELERLRLGVKEEISFELEDYERPGVELEASDGVAVLRIGAFHSETPTNVAVSLRALAGEGEAKLEGLTEPGKLLVDLRGVAGGDERAAYAVAGLFTHGELGILTSRGEVVEVFETAAEPEWQGRVVVLIDRATQGPAEVLAAVLGQTADAVLVGGSLSFGHCGRQSLVQLSNGGSLQITDAFFTGPDREPIRGGLHPDILVRRRPGLAEEEEDATRDPILERGLTVLLEDEEVEEEVEAKQAA